MVGLRAAVALILCAPAAFGGGIVLDGSFGPSGALPGPNYMISASLGKQVGNNLFHSFSQFDLISSESATFTGPGNIQNILSRVTGGSPSSIDGRISSDIQGANLFFLNPSGVMFGSHARIDVTGSFAVSTASYLKLADGGRFNANLGGGDLLSSAPVSAFGFLNAAPAAISFVGTNLVAAQKAISAIGGDISIDGGAVGGQGSGINLISVRSAGEALLDSVNPNGPIDVNQFTLLGDIRLTNGARLDTNGPIAVTGNNLLLTDSSIASNAVESGTAGTISVIMRNRIEIGGGQISTTTFGAGNGGNITVTGDSLLIDGSSNLSQAAGILANSTAGATGTSGNISVIMSGPVMINTNGQIAATTFSSAKGGNVSVHADSLAMDGLLAPDLFTGIQSTARGDATGPAGKAMVSVNGSLTITNGAEISAATHAAGNAGDLQIVAGSLTVDGSATPQTTTGIGVDTSGGSSGNGGNVQIDVAGSLNLLNTGEITAVTSSSGRGGNLSVHAGSLFIDGSEAPDKFTGIATNSNPGGTGDAGSLDVRVDRALTILGTGQIAANTFGSGGGGDLSVHAGSILIDGSNAPSKFTGIGAGSEPAATGDAGNVDVTADRMLTIIGAGEIGANTFGEGRGGDLSVHAGSILIDGSATLGKFTGIAADSERTASGDAGNLELTIAGSLNIIGGGQIRADTFSSGNGGTLSVHAGSLSIDGSSAPEQVTGISAYSFASSGGNAGNLNVTVVGALNIFGSGTIAASTFSNGNGGNVTIHANSLVIDGGPLPDLVTGITSDAAAGTGNGGDVKIMVQQLLLIAGGGSIQVGTFSQGAGGELTITAGSLSINGSAAPDTFTGITAGAFDGTGSGGDVGIHVRGLLKITGAGEITADTFTSGRAGNLAVTAGRILINGAHAQGFPTDISATSAEGATGEAGNIDITVDTALQLLAGASISTDSIEDGGNITIHASGLVYLNQSSITASAAKTGGNITIDPQFIVLNNSPISANAAQGLGGNINLVSNFFFASSSPVTATGAVANGTINITAPELDLGAELITLPASLVDAQTRLQERCTSLLQGDFSSFISLGRGGTEQEPDEPQSDF